MNSVERLNKTDRSWILLAHRSGARLFSSIGYGKDLKQLQEFNFPEGRLKSQEIDTDDNGGLEKQEGAVFHIAKLFAHQLAEHLRQGRVDNAYDRLILIAEPRFLGMLRSHLDKETAKKIIETTRRNYTDLPKNDLTQCLKNIISGHQEAA